MARFAPAVVGAVAATLLAATAASAEPFARAPDPAGLLRDGPEVERVSVVHARGGARAGRVVVRVRMRYGSMVPRAVRRLPDRGMASHHGRLRVTVLSGRRRLGSARDLDALVLSAPRRAFRFTHHVVLGRATSARVRAAGRVRVGVEARQEVRVDGRGRPETVLGERERASARVVRAPTAPRVAAPVCERYTLRAGYARRSRAALVCMGEGVSFRLVRRPSRGRARILAASRGRAVIEYRPRARYVGRDRIALRAVAAGTRAAGLAGRVVSLPIDVQPFKLRAIGDSVTAGFGFLGDGTAWGPSSLPSCVPPDTPNDRCSSNSPNGPGQTGPVGWLDDFGLGNGVAWPARFARQRGLTGEGMFANYAVSGATPAAWDTGGVFNETLQGIVADHPDLTVMTLGANPLLDESLFGSGIECSVSLTDDRLRACVQGFIDDAQVVPRLRSVLGQLLAAPGNRVVVSQYHQAIPSTAPFSVDQLRIVFSVVNLNVRRAARLVDGFGTRVYLMAPPQFNVGMPPGPARCPSGGSYTVDGPSRQARVSQDELTVDHPFVFCGTTEYWIISADSGIHPSFDGHTQFATALAQLAQANGLVPPLP